MIYYQEKKYKSDLYSNIIRNKILSKYPLKNYD